MSTPEPGQLLLVNAFSLNMLPDELSALSLQIRRLTPDQAAALAPQASSAVGHPDTATIFSSVLGIPVPCARRSLLLTPGDRLLVGQYSGPRLPPGAERLPDGAQLRWLLVALDG